MLHLIAIFAFASLFVAAATLLHMTVRENWADMVAAFMGRPMPSRLATRPMPAVKVVAVRKQRAAA